MRARIGPSAILSKPDTWRSKKMAAEMYLKQERGRQGSCILPWEDTSFWKNQKKKRALPVLSKALLSSDDISQHILYSENLRKECRNDRLLRTSDWEF